MKSPLAKFTLVAFLATPLVSPAQNLFSSADRMGQLTLLTGPKLLSPATATGEIAPGHLRILSKPVAQAISADQNSFYSVGAPRQFTFGASGGTLTFRPASGSPKARENFLRPLKLLPNPADPESFRFDLKLLPTEIRPLEKAPPPANSNLKLNP